jgi:uncharacterized protein
LAYYILIIMDEIIGRFEEKIDLARVLETPEAELVAVYGRRRIGKTYLIRAFFSKQIIFEFTGVHNASLKDQLKNFSEALTDATGSLPLAKPANWRDAFSMLKDYLTPLIKKQKKVVFFDEFPWISTPKSGFLQAFDYFWNTWASRQKNLVFIICGSAASWMIKKIINNRGGLHNRVTKRINLSPFSLSETEEYLTSRKIKLNHYQLVQLYMIMGGIPLYLKQVLPGESVVQCIDRVCFTKKGLLNNEFKLLYSSLFDNAENHVAVIRALSVKPNGLTRNEIIEACSFKSGGWITTLLDELTESGFISTYSPFGKTSKDSIYRITDEYSLFYIKFIENNKSKDKGTWHKLSESASWKGWSGLAFESICLKHFKQIKKAIGIEDVYTEISSWRYHPKKGEQGTQIDLLFDRKDGCINLCEIKFSISELSIDKSYAAILNQKINVFREVTKTNKVIFLTMITAHGLKKNDYYTELVQKEITMKALFEDYAL